ncbi:MAG: 5'-methylthioadenosine/adenosylhomocysteine nucleosidase [Muribaculaceae bacterium]|nr:5'-methylthioadenosine/adenosylhomocysteine nucleosidase [Muribaculaceae bacterium]
MKILILAAMDKELDLLINLLENPQKHEYEDISFWKGNSLNHEIILTKCGIGKVNSALRTLNLLHFIKPDLVINSGVAGGAGCPIGSVIVADALAYHDVWCGPGTEYGQADGLPLLMKPSQKVLDIAAALNLSTGLICTGDKFISTSEEIQFIKSKFPEVKAVDMESAAIAQTCLMLETPFAIVRVVSDTPGDGENISQYKDFWEKAPEKTFLVLNSILSHLK